jgi:hypothetical protein
MVMKSCRSRAVGTARCPSVRRGRLAWLNLQFCLCAALHTVHDCWLPSNRTSSAVYVTSHFLLRELPIFLKSVKKTVHIDSNIFHYVRTTVLNIIPLTRRSAKSCYGSRLTIGDNIKANLKINKVLDRI